MINVPLSVISGISPKNTSCSLISRTLFFPVSGSLEYTVSRMVTLSGAAAPARRTQMVQPFQVAALAFPVADRIIDELQVAHTAEIGNRENTIEYGLQADVLALVGQQIHLQEPFV